MEDHLSTPFLGSYQKKPGLWYHVTLSLISPELWVPLASFSISQREEMIELLPLITIHKTGAWNNKALCAFCVLHLFFSLCNLNLILRLYHYWSGTIHPENESSYPRLATVIDFCFSPWSVLHLYLVNSSVVDWESLISKSGKTLFQCLFQTYLIL